MTLTELLIASTLLVVLLTVVMTTMNLLGTVTDQVSAQYQENDQAIPALAPLETLIRSEVEPAPPTAVGAPTPGFGIDTPAVAPATADQISGIGNFSLTFYANIGTAYNNVTGTGTTAGPAKIVALELDSNGNPVVSSPPALATTCSSATPCSFQVREYLPVVDSFGVSSCPFPSVQPLPPPTPDPTPGCNYSTTYKVITNVLHVINNPYLQSGGGPAQPIFTYDILDTTNQLAFQLSPAEVETGPIQLSTDRGYPAGTPSVSLTSCSAPNSTYPTCPADAIQSVGIDLMIGVKGSGSNGNVENQVIAYRDTPASVPLFLPTYPYLYSNSVG